MDLLSPGLEIPDLRWGEDVAENEVAFGSEELLLYGCDLSVRSHCGKTPRVVSSIDSKMLGDLL